jgi:hypothetical protein
LESFDRSRSSAVRAFQLLDQKLTETVTSLNREDCGDSLRTHVAVILDEKKDLLEKLDHLSGKIIELISAAQRELEVELAASKKQKEVLGKFKSIPGSNSGKGLDRTL